MNTQKMKEMKMETKEEHMKIVEQKSKKSIEKFEMYMLGVGLFRDFDEVVQEKRVRERKEEHDD